LPRNASNGHPFASRAGQKHSTIAGHSGYHPTSLPRLLADLVLSNVCLACRLGFDGLESCEQYFKKHKYNELMKFTKTAKYTKDNTFLLVNCVFLAFSASASFSALFFSSSACFRFSSCAFRNVVTNVKRVEITAEK
jgi:hypothetical protein